MYTTIQTPEQLREDVGLLKRMMGDCSDRSGAWWASSCAACPRVTSLLS
jgi:hypothetical protein